MNTGRTKHLYVPVARPVVSKFSSSSSNGEAETNPTPANEKDTSATRVNPDDDPEEEKEEEEEEEDTTNNALKYFAKLQDPVRMAAFHKMLEKQNAKKANQAKVEGWLRDVPIDGTLRNASIAATPTVDGYIDRLSWSATNAHKWLERLEAWELRYRIAGLKYHKVPAPLRHATIVSNGSKIELEVLTRLAEVFNPSRHRDQQAFFLPWVYISDVATDIIQLVAVTEEQQQTQPQTVMQLSAQHAGYEMILDSLWSKRDDVERALCCLEGMVERMAERSDGEEKGKERLTERHSREGTLFRQWIQNFGEIEYVKNVPEWIEKYVHDVLKGGLEKERCWHVIV